MPKKKRKTYPRKFLVGYRGQLQCVYGRERLYKPPVENSGICDRMTINQAKRLKKSMPCSGATIYELVEIIDI